MIDFKKNIAEKIGKAIKIASNGSEEVQEIEVQEIERYIEEPKDSKNGDYAFPCFKLSKQLKKAPVQIANEIKEKIEMEQEIVTEIKVESGYLNFYINKNTLAKEVIQEISQKEEYGASKIGEGKNIIVEYSSPNIAKQFHIGHLRTTIIGATLYEIYKYLGYNAIGINHLGDYGTQFGKLIEGYKRWKDEYDIDSNPIEELTKIYIRISELCKQDESVLEASRENFPYFATTLTLSPYKNSDFVNEIGAILDQEYATTYLYSDFKKKNGYQRSIELSKKYHLYRQDYCGCIYSKLQKTEE